MRELQMPDIPEMLSALGEVLGSRGQRYELVLIGGASLQLHGVISRPTRDADVLAERVNDRLVPMPNLPEDLRAAVRDVGEAYAAAPDWLNTGPQSLIELGLPPGFHARLERRDFDPGLVIWLAGRYDLVCFKLYAAADEWPTRGRHLQDLRALDPDPETLRTAARWARSHDPSPGFRERQLGPLLRELGVDDDGRE
jgi:hypothetical protein